MGMFTTKLNIMLPVFGVMIALIEPAFAHVDMVIGNKSRTKRGARFHRYS
jgi:hypothetical protein